MKRINFSSIHADANIPCQGYTPLPVRTGYDNIIPYRVNSLFASMAIQDGKVSSITPHEITVLYADNTSKTYPLGRQYGKEGSLTIPHFLKTDLTIGQSFKKGQALSYNDSYFQPDPIDPSLLTTKFATLATTAVLENSYTLDRSYAFQQALYQPDQSPKHPYRLQPDHPWSAHSWYSSRLRYSTVYLRASSDLTFTALWSESFRCSKSILRSVTQSEVSWNNRKDRTLLSRQQRRHVGISKSTCW